MSGLPFLPLIFRHQTILLDGNVLKFEEASFFHLYLIIIFESELLNGRYTDSSELFQKTLNYARNVLLVVFAFPPILYHLNGFDSEAMEEILNEILELTVCLGKLVERT